MKRIAVLIIFIAMISNALFSYTVFSDEPIMSGYGSASGRVGIALEFTRDGKRYTGFSLESPRPATTSQNYSDFDGSVSSELSTLSLTTDSTTNPASLRGVGECYFWVFVGADGWSFDGFSVTVNIFKPEKMVVSGGEGDPLDWDITFANVAGGQNRDSSMDLSSSVVVSSADTGYVKKKIYETGNDGFTHSRDSNALESNDFAYWEMAVTTDFVAGVVPSNATYSGQIIVEIAGDR